MIIKNKNTKNNSYRKYRLRHNIIFNLSIKTIIFYYYKW